MNKGDYQKLVASLIGLITVIITFSATILDLTNQPQLLRISSLLGYVVFAGGILWFAFKSKNISQGWRWASLGLLYLLSIPFFIWVGSWAKTQNDAFKQFTLLDIPLRPIEIYDFETPADPTDTTPWDPFPSEKKPSLLISDEQAFARSGTHSLRMKVDNQAYHTNMEIEYSGIGLTGADLSQVKAVTAWVLIPRSEAVQNITFEGHIMLYMDQQDNEAVGFFGETRELEPGVWTPLFIGTFHQTDALSGVVWDREVDELYLTIWSDKPYNGSIYIDDLTVYEEVKL
jgi:hypothetical protein